MVGTTPVALHTRDGAYIDLPDPDNDSRRSTATTRCGSRRPKPRNEELNMTSEEYLGKIGWQKRGLVMDTKLYHYPVCRISHSAEDILKFIEIQLKALQTEHVFPSLTSNFLSGMQTSSTTIL
ncbi:hypothetical protein LXA43DRAFT_1091076 [Ganoderma leucocontextum]|nr:hypothetical protein LXA43DRAFT_1091076 [Ganoderma leucocontextum]